MIKRQIIIRNILLGRFRRYALLKTLSVLLTASQERTTILLLSSKKYITGLRIISHGQELLNILLCQIFRSMFIITKEEIAACRHSYSCRCSDTKEFQSDGRVAGWYPRTIRICTTGARYIMKDQDGSR